MATGNLFKIQAGDMVKVFPHRRTYRKRADDIICDPSSRCHVSQNTFIEIPVTVAVIGTVLAPVLAAVGAISALVAKFRVVVVRAEPKPPGAGEKKTEP
jgi:hypothetical protein